MSRSSIRVVAGVQVIGLGLPSSCARCRGWGSWLGFVPDEVTAAPPVAVTRLAERLTIDPAELQGYGRREQTRTGHLQSAAGYLGWKQAPPGGAAMKELEQFLPATLLAWHRKLW